MLYHLDNVLRHLLMTKINSIADEAQISFQPPDEEWRSHVASLQGNALNIYLVDLHENRKLRSNERVRNVQNGTVSETPTPRRIDCHYLISAWSPITATPSLEPTLDEHQLLYQVLSVLMNAEPLIPRQVYDRAPLPPGFPAILADAELPTTILPAEGFPKLVEFWGAMGLNYRWKPVIYLVVTLPVGLPTVAAGPIVTTRITRYQQNGQPSSVEMRVQIGGHVRNGQGADSKLIPKAHVCLETTEGETLQSTETTENGRFSFQGVTAGEYCIHIAHPDLGTTRRKIDVPARHDNYDVSFEDGG